MTKESLSLIVLLLAAGQVASADDPVSASPAGMALESIFNPQRAPAQKTMGLLQRSFLDLVETSEPNLQVAFVVDGTDSMAKDLAGVRAALKNMMDDLRQYKGEHVSFALVIYRDVGAPAGPVVMPLSQFSADDKVLAEGFEKLLPETGAPYFLELPDLGVHEALDKLNWTADKETSRWLLLFGDAPPYDANFNDTEGNTGARRRYDTDILVNLAQRKAVQISCVLCTSREEERTVYDQVLDKTRQFMNSLSTDTGGLMLDLSYPDIRAALVAAAKKQRVERKRIGAITREEVEAVRQAAATKRLPVNTTQRLRVAVLPHLPLNQMTFDPTHPAVQIAAELRQKFKAMNQTEVRSPVDVERALQRVKSANVPTNQWLQAMAVQLRVDYIVWGGLRSAEGVVQVRSAVYAKTDGQKLVETSVLSTDKIPEIQLAGNLINRLALTEFDQQQGPELHATLSQVRSDTTLNNQLVSPVANTSEARTDLLTGFEALEQALAYPIGDAAAAPLLTQAEQSLTRAAGEDPRNPFAHMLLTSCYFNQAQAAASAGQTAAAKEKSQKSLEALKRAYRERDNTQVDLLKLEITADYTLLVKKDYAEAIKLYTQLSTAPNDVKLHTALRGHWMLAGILTGDWGAGEALVDAPKARAELIQILAHWPDSPEAAFIKANLRWNEDKGRTQFENFPRTNDI